MSPAARSQMQLSRSGQMRLAFAEGKTVREIADEFEVSYHTAYSAVVFNAGRQSQPARVEQTVRARVALREASRSATAASKASSHLLTSALIQGPASFTEASEDELFALWASAAPNRSARAARVAATAELDRRDATGEWLDKARAWAAARGEVGS